MTLLSVFIFILVICMSIATFGIILMHFCNIIHKKGKRRTNLYELMIAIIFFVFSSSLVLKVLTTEGFFTAI